MDNIVGYVHVKDLYRAPRDATLRRLLRPIGFIAETSNIELALQRFQSTRTPLAIVVDEHGGTAGIVTIQDVVEELIGEVQDEFDLEAPLVEDRGRRQLLGRRRGPDRLPGGASWDCRCPKRASPPWAAGCSSSCSAAPGWATRPRWATSMPACSRWTACASPGCCSPASRRTGKRMASWRTRRPPSAQTTTVRRTDEPVAVRADRAEVSFPA